MYRALVASQVVLEMIEVRDVDTARAMLKQTRVFANMRQEEPDRFQRLDTLCGRTYFDIRCVHAHISNLLRSLISL